jgi:hypothetical protein
VIEQTTRAGRWGFPSSAPAASHQITRVHVQPMRVSTALSDDENQSFRGVGYLDKLLNSLSALKDLFRTKKCKTEKKKKIQK